jgi:hypothetical protein
MAMGRCVAWGPRAHDRAFMKPRLYPRLDRERVSHQQVYLESEEESDEAFPDEVFGPKARRS